MICAITHALKSKCDELQRNKRVRKRPTRPGSWVSKLGAEYAMRDSRASILYLTPLFTEVSKFRPVPLSFVVSFLNNCILESRTWLSEVIRETRQVLKACASLESARHVHFDIRVSRAIVSPCSRVSAAVQHQRALQDSN